MWIERSLWTTAALWGVAGTRYLSGKNTVVAATAHAPPAAVLLRGLQANDTDASVVACPTGNDLLAREALPVLTSLCPTQCAIDNLCIYFPANATSECTTTTSGRTCHTGDGCAFECIPRLAGGDGWWIALVTDATVLDEVDTANLWHSSERAISINASVVHGIVGTLDVTGTNEVAALSGNEAPNNSGDDNHNDYLDDKKVFPTGEILAFDIPATYYETLQGVEYIKLENLRFNEPPPNVSLSFTRLTELFLRNTLLTTVPLLNASFPKTTVFDFSANQITEVTSLPNAPVLERVNLATNAITKLAPNLFLPSVWFLDVSSNPLKEIAVGTLPSTLQMVILRNTSITAVPGDIANMSGLLSVRLDHNTIKVIPDGAIPPEQLVELSVQNCSLTAIPPSVQAMGVLGNLYLDGNDLSRDANFSMISPSVAYLSLKYCKLQKLSEDFQQLNVSEIVLDGNPQAMKDLSKLPPATVALHLNDNQLTALPSVISSLGNLFTLSILANPLETILPGALPQSLVELMASDAKFRSLDANTLPRTLGNLKIVDCILEQVPTDLGEMTGLKELNLKGNRLQAFDATDGLLKLVTINLSGNRLTTFSGAYPAAVTMDLRNNTIQQFNVTSASNLTTLHLADNGLTAMPTSIFSMLELTVLNLTRNPIRGFAPTADQINFLSKVETIVMDQAMFATNCGVAETVRLRGFSVCKSTVQQSTSEAVARSGVSVSVIVAVACLCVVLLALAFVWWRRRARQKAREKDIGSDTVSLEEQLLSDSSIWSDSLLLQHRLDANLVTRTRLMGSGASGEVWLASYRNELVAVKSLKPTDISAVPQFVEEIKLVLALSHPRIVAIVGVVWTMESDLALVTEYMAGGDLRSYLDRTPGPPTMTLASWTPQMLQIALEIAEAVVYLHSLDPVVIHRDLTSHNVLLDGDMHAKLTDFGVSRILDEDETMTATVGTLRWTAPEVLARERYDASADIYSLGVILSEIDTHKLPFEDATDETSAPVKGDAAFVARLLSGSLTCSVSNACPQEIRELVERCTSFDRLARPTALLVAYELRKLANID